MLVKKRKKKATKCSVDSLVIKIQKHKKTFISKQTQTQREREWLQFSLPILFLLRRNRRAGEVLTIFSILSSNQNPTHLLILHPNSKVQGSFTRKGFRVLFIYLLKFLNQGF